jgi:hypothetical protein
MLQPLQPKRRSLARFEGAEAVLSYYPSGHFMAEHAHECDQRSMILSGGLFEETPSHTARPQRLISGSRRPVINTRTAMVRTARSYWR